MIQRVRIGIGINMQKIKTKSATYLMKPKAKIVFGLFAFAIVGSVSMQIVRADTLQQQINSLNSQNAQNQQNVDNLQLQAANYQDAINKLQQQVSSIQAAIAANEAEQASLQAQIVADQVKLAQEKQVLGEDIKAMYVNGTMSTVEMLATTNNLSTFVDAETYRGAVQTKIQGTLADIAKTQNELEAQQASVTQLLGTEHDQQAQLSSDEQQQINLRNMNEQQQADYNNQIQANKAQISKLLAEQAAANASIARSVDIRASGGSGGYCDIGYGNGGYPMSLCNSAQDSITDAYGFPSRECTSFAYWYFVTQEGQSNFQVSGNAGWWWETSNYPAVTWSSDVKVGAIGIEPSSATPAPVPSLHGGYYGHVMIVKALPGQTYQGVSVPSGYVLVASMNEDEAGHFMYNLWPVSYLMFINPQ